MSTTPAVRKPQGNSPLVKRKFAFNLRKPIFTGPLLKQGHYHKAFKSRYFILYPGFLVYYESPEKWQYDLQRGDTLGSRLGAIKLKGGTILKTKNAPKGAKYAFTILCPDASNRRNDVMFNCHSNEERYQWMANIHSAIPDINSNSSSPKTERKEEKEQVDSPQTTTEEVTPTPPETTLRQDTVSEAALLATSKEDEGGDIEETHTDDILGPVTSPTDSDNEDTAIENGNGDSNEVTSSASIKVDSPVPPPNTANDTETDDAALNSEKQQDEDDDDDTIPLPESLIVIERTIKPDERAQFLISVVDHSLLADSDVDLSEEDPTNSPVHRKPSQEGGASNTSSPPPAADTSIPPPPSDTPTITITTGTLKKEPTTAAESPKTEGGQSKDSDSGNSSPELSSAFNRDTRRPSGAMSLVDKRGYLYKMGGKVKSWNLRYFVLQPGVFRYFKNDPNGKQLGEVKLKNVKVLLPKEGEKVFSSFQFTVHTESSWNKRMDWSIAAANEKDMKEWMEAFQVAGGSHPSRESNGSE